jgi:serine protease
LLQRFWSLCYLAIAIAASASSSARAQGFLIPRTPTFSFAIGNSAASRARTPGQVVVRFRTDLPRERRDQIITGLGSRIESVDAGSCYILVRARDDRTDDLLAVLGQRGEVLHAEPSYQLHTMAESLYDPYQWNLFTRGTASGRAVSNFGIQAAAAWKHTRGEGITVAVLDTGVAYEDFDEFSQAPGLANTHFVAGYDFVNNDEHPNDDEGHGTHVTGILAGNLLDGGGSVGAAPDVDIMPIKALGANGLGSDFAIARGIRWAADHGAQVINMSLGGEGAGQVLSEAVRYAAARDCVLIAAGGNENAPEVGYPAYYSDCVAVGATGFDGIRAPYSNRGRRLLVVAPGGNLGQDLNEDDRPDGIVAQTFDPDRGYDSFDYFYPYAGTSMACPQVAGAAALIRAANPALSALDVRLILQDTAFHLGSPGRNSYYGYGLVDALAGVEAALAQR